jgi:hypothetical protein
LPTPSLLWHATNFAVFVVLCCITSGYVATSPLPLAPGVFASSSSNGNLEQQQQQLPSQSQQQQQQQNGHLSGSLGSALSLSSHEQALRNTPQAFSHFTFEFTKVRNDLLEMFGSGNLFTMLEAWYMGLTLKHTKMHEALVCAKFAYMAVACNA